MAADMNLLRDFIVGRDILLRKVKQTVLSKLEIGEKCL